MDQKMTRLVAICVECGLGLVVARIDLDLDSINNGMPRGWKDLPSNSLTSNSRPDFRFGVLARGQNQLITFHDNHVSETNFHCLEYKKEIHSNSHPSRL